MKRLIPLFLIVLTLLAVSCNPEAKVETFTVTFDPDNSEAETAQPVQKGKTAKAPDDPKKEGTEGFAFWLTESGDIYDFDEPVTSDISLKAYYYSKLEGDNATAANAMMMICSIFYDKSDLESVSDAELAQFFLFANRESCGLDNNGLYYKNGTSDTSRYYLSAQEDENAKYVYVEITAKTADKFESNKNNSKEVPGATESTVEIAKLKITGNFKEGTKDATTGAIVEKTDNPAFTSESNSVQISTIEIGSIYTTVGGTNTPIMLSLITNMEDGTPVMYLQTNNIQTKEVVQILRKGNEFYKTSN